MFFKAPSQIFFGISKKNCFTVSVTLRMTIQIFFFKKVCKKKSPMKFVGDFLSWKEHVRAHPNEYEIYVKEYLLVWKKTQAASGNNRNNVFWGLILFFFRIFEKKLISHKNCLQSDHLKLFIFEKNLSKKFDNKNGKKKVSK